MLMIFFISCSTVTRAFSQHLDHSFALQDAGHIPQAQQQPSLVQTHLKVHPKIVQMQDRQSLSDAEWNLSEQHSSIALHCKAPVTLNSQASHLSHQDHVQSKRKGFEPDRVYSLDEQHRHCAHIATASDTDHMDHQHHNTALSQAHCDECPQQHCQNGLSVLNALESVNIAFFNVAQTHSQNFNYQAQHLLGHWQEILRPPKA